MPNAKKNPDPKVPTVNGVPINDPPAPTPAPTPPETPPSRQPSGAVSALQEQIVGLITARDREMAKVALSQAKVSLWQGRLHAAQAALQGDITNLTRLDQEVQYRMGVIDQLEGRAPSAPQYPQQAYPMAPTSGPNLVTTSQPYQGDDSDLVNRAHATRALAVI